MSGRGYNTALMRAREREALLEQRVLDLETQLRITTVAGVCPACNCTSSIFTTTAIATGRVFYGHSTTHNASQLGNDTRFIYTYVKDRFQQGRAMGTLEQRVTALENDKQVLETLTQTLTETRMAVTRLEGKVDTWINKHDS